MRQKSRWLAKGLSLALAMTMALGMSVTAFAADNKDLAGFGDKGYESSNEGEKGYPSGMTGVEGMNGSTGAVQRINVDTEDFKVKGTNADRGTISVSGIETEGVTVTAYQIIKPVYGDNGMFAGWSDEGLGVETVDDKGAVIEDAFSREGINAMMNTVTSTGIEMKNTGGSDTYKADDVEPGAYLVTVTGGGSKTYGAMVVSLYYTDAETLTGTGLKLTNNMAFAKMQDGPTVEKSITAVETQDDDHLQGLVHNNEAGTIGESALANVGDTVWFDIYVSNIPEYNGDHPVFKVIDAMDANLDYVEGSAQYIAYFADALPKDYLGGGYDIAPSVNVRESAMADTGEATGARNEIEFDFAANGYSLNDYAGYNLVIHYAAKVVADTDIGYNDNGIAAMPNKARVEYTHNSTVDGSDGTDYTDDRTVYTAKIELTKVDALTKEPLEGAEFQLTQYDAENDKDIVVVDRIVSEADGTICIEGIVPGIYYIHETKQPGGGYVLSDDEYEIVVIVKDNEGTAWGENENGTATAVVMSIEGGAETNTFAIPNVKMTDLPTTGGAGSALIIGLGICGAIAACAVIFGTRKKTEE